MNQVTYEMPAAPVVQWTPGRIVGGCFALLAVALVAFLVLGPQGSMLLAATGALLFGVNSVAYETPVVGATAPTATQARTHQEVVALVTGDGAATTFTITHNWGLTAAELAAPWPEVILEYTLAAGYTAAALVGTRLANSVAFTCTAFTGAGLRVRLKRPHSIDR